MMMPHMEELEMAISRLHRMKPKDVSGYVLLDPVYLPRNIFDDLKKEYDHFLQKKALKDQLGMITDFSTWLVNKLILPYVEDQKRNGAGT